MPDIQVMHYDVRLTEDPIKAYLAQVRRLDVRITTKLAEWNRLRDMQDSRHRSYNSMPRSGRRRDWTNLVVRIAAVEAEAAQLRREQNALKAEIEQQIDMLPDERYRDLLECRYLMLWDWRKIAKVMNYSESHVFRLHRAALQEFAKIHKR